MPSPNLRTRDNHRVRGTRGYIPENELCGPVQGTGEDRGVGAWRLLKELPPLGLPRCDAFLDEVMGIQRPPKALHMPSSPSLPAVAAKNSA
jgi:hypothetical protein